MNWRKGPSQGDTDPRGFSETPEGEALFAVWARCGFTDPRYFYAVGTLDDDFEIETGDGPWGWSWDDVSWWVPMGEIQPPPAAGAGGEE